MTGRLANRVALVIGAARGIGEGIALRFVEEGAKVMIADTEVEDDGGRHDRYLPVIRGEADLALVEVPHHAGRRIETERTPAGQHDGVHLVDEVERAEQVRFTGARGGPADIHATDRTGLGQDDGAAGRPSRRRVVAHFDPVNGREAARVAHRHGADRRAEDRAGGQDGRGGRRARARWNVHERHPADRTTPGWSLTGGTGTTCRGRLLPSVVLHTSP